MYTFGGFMKEKLSIKQERVFHFIQQHIQNFGYPPTLREIASKLGISGPHGVKKFIDILVRKGYIRKTARSSRAIEIVGEKAGIFTRALPILGKIRAGSPLLAVENIEGNLSVDASIARWEQMFLLRVEGDSMIEAHIREGDLAIIRTQAMVENGEIAAVLIDDEATIKYFFREMQAIRLQPANTSMEPLIIQEGQSEVRIIGKVVGIIRILEGGESLYGSVSR
jgi:repressor LexA